MGKKAPGCGSVELSNVFYDKAMLRKIPENPSSHNSASSGGARMWPFAYFPNPLAAYFPIQYSPSRSPYR
jgi:hypothetical protein